MSRVHTGELLPLATKRLQKESQAWANRDETITSQGTISANPYPDDLSRWCANLTLCDGSYSGINFHIYIEVPPNYPAAPPSAYFKTDIHYSNGAQYQVEGKGISICLDLLGNFAFVHTEWATSGEASGWSPSYTVSTILITLQGALPEMLSNDRRLVQQTASSSKGFSCKCGHKGNDPLNYCPLLGFSSKKMAAVSAATTPLSKQSSSSSSPNTSVLSSSSSSSALTPSEEISCLLSATSHELLQKMILTHLSEDDIRKALSPKEEEPAVPSLLPLLLPLDHIVCYATGCNPITDPEEIFGMGIRVEPTNGLLQTPAEILTYSAFENGVKRSTTNQNLDFFLPIFVSFSHWRQFAFPLFQRCVTQIFAHTTKLTRKDQFPAPPVQAALLLCSLMNATCLAAEEAGTAEKTTANDRFINGYFILLRLLKGLANSIPGVREYAEKKIASFLSSPERRNKDPIRGCPNLGEFILLLHISKKYNWKDVSHVFAEESEIRRVRWYAKEHPFLGETECAEELYFPEERLRLTLQLTETSRRLICFQVKFLLLSKNVSLNEFADAAVPEGLLKSMKSLHQQIGTLKNWNDYLAFIGLPRVSDSERNMQIISAVKSSAARGYHRTIRNNNNNNNNYNNNYNNGPRREGRGQGRGVGRGRGGAGRGY
jgi:ubiquitin-protein ligase